MFFSVSVQPERRSQVPLRPYFGLFSVSGFCTFVPVWVMRRRGDDAAFVMPLSVARVADFCRCFPDPSRPGTTPPLFLPAGLLSS